MAAVTGEISGSVGRQMQRRREDPDACHSAAGTRLMTLAFGRRSMDVKERDRRRQEIHTIWLLVSRARVEQGV